MALAKGTRGVDTRSFLRSKLLSLAARARRLGRMDHAMVGIRPQDLPYALRIIGKVRNPQLAQAVAELRTVTAAEAALTAAREVKYLAVSVFSNASGT